MGNILGNYWYFMIVGFSGFGLVGEDGFFGVSGFGEEIWGDVGVGFGEGGNWGGGFGGGGFGGYCNELVVIWEW